MANGINKVILIGSLGKDPEVRYMPNGKAVSNITVATSESWKDQQGQQHERTEWHRCTMYDRLAEIAGEYLKKGSKVFLEGKLQTREWQDQQGQKRYTTEIIVSEMQMLSSRASGGQGAVNGGANQGTQNHRPQSQPQQNSGYPQQSQGQSQPAVQPQQNQGVYSGPNAQGNNQAWGQGGGGGGMFDDDIPFVEYFPYKSACYAI